MVGGFQTEEHEYPWQVFIESPDKREEPWCGGSLITNQHVLTAAHCIIGEDHNRNTDPEYKQTFDFLLEHPWYIREVTKNAFL